MAEKIFENYINKCPVCGAELDSESKYCAYCGANLEELNTQYHDNEQQIHDAQEDIKEAKERIETREVKFKEAQKSKKNIWKKVVMIAACLFFGQLVLALIVSGIFALTESAFEADKEEFCQALLNKNVDTIEADDFNYEDQAFEKFGKSNAAGEIEFTEEFLKMPFRASNYDNTSIFSGNIVFKNGNVDEIYTFRDDSLNMYFEECRVSVNWDVASYYEDSTDYLTIFEREDFENIERLDNYQVGDLTFECYVDRSYTDEYIFVASPYRECFIVIQLEDRDYDSSMSFKEALSYIVGIQTEYAMQ